ncbi:MAG: C39 family peptidase [bacterium]
MKFFMCSFFKKLSFLLIVFLPLTNIYPNKSQNSNRTPQFFSKTYSKFLKHNPKNIKKKTYIWSAKTFHPFDELILSWNAKRPTQGFITFWISLFHKKWSGWHKIAEWGSNYQLTFANKKNPLVHSTYVKIQTQKGLQAQGFKIRAVFNNGAQMKNLHALFACCSDLKKFKRTSPNFNLPSTMIQGVPLQSQMVLDHYRAHHLCSPTSLSMIISYFNKTLGIPPQQSLHDYSIDFAEKVHDLSPLNIFGSWPLNIAQAYHETYGNIFYRTERLNNFYDLYRRLVNKIPVAVSVRKLKNGATPYSNGHFLVVIGWDRSKQSIICLDPAFSPTSTIVKKYKLSDFLKAWGRSYYLSYIPLPKKNNSRKKTISA